MRTALSFKSKTAFVFTIINFCLIFSFGSELKIYGQPISVSDASAIEFEANEKAAEWNESSYRRAFSLFLEAATAWQKLGNLPKKAECLREAAQLSFSLKDLKTARLLLEQALNAESKPSDIGGRSQTLSLLLLISMWEKDLERAANLQKTAVSLAEKSGDRLAAAKAYFAAAQFQYRDQRKLAVMKELQEKSLQLFREIGDHANASRTLTELAYTAVMNNDRITGQNLADEAVSLSRKTGNKRDLAFALISSGDAYQRVGNWEEALHRFTEAEALYPESLDPNEKAILFVRFGFHYEAFNDLVQARSYFQKARQLFIESGNLYGNSELATRIGQISFRLGEKSEALKNFNEGLQIGRRSGDKYSIAYFYENIGELYFSDAEHRKALDYYQKALLNFDQIGIKHPVASVKEKMGLLFSASGDKTSAEKVFNEALKIHLDIRDKNGQSDDLYYLARLHYENGQLDSALEKIGESLKLTESIENETANNKLKQSYVAEIFERYQFRINLLMQKHRRMPNESYFLEALQTAERSRARSLLQNMSLSQAEFTKDADPEVVKRETEILEMLTSKADELTDMLSGNTDKAKTEQLSFEINELNNELETIKATLRQSSPIYSAIKNPAPFNVTEFQEKILDENSLFLEFSLGNDESYLWLIEKNSVSTYILPPRAEIETRVEKLRGSLESRILKDNEKLEDFQQRMNDAEKTFQDEAKMLSRQLLGQVADRLSKKRLIIVADGKLHYFPFAALPAPGADTDEPLLLSNETIYAPSAQTLLLLEKSRQNKETAKNLLIFSDPIFNEEDQRLETNAGKSDLASEQVSLKETFRFAESLKELPRLLASKNERESILEIIGASTADSFSGFEANREHLLKVKADDYKIIHFATHGITNEERPELSGIVLSGLNEQGAKQTQLFRIHDIYSLNLNADLVVLSACETGLGKEIRGEGLMSLNNAFLQTGAKSVMASLWKVEDTATLELMKYFYAAIANDDLTPSQALRQAQISLRQNSQYRSPFYWAAFTVQGDFRNVPKISQDFNKLFYLLAVLPVALFLFFLFRKKNAQL